MKLKKMIAAILAVGILVMECESLFFASEMPIRLYDVEQAERLVEKVVETANNGDWVNFTECMCKDEQSYYEYYFANDELEDGIKQIESMELVEIYEVEKDLAEQEWLAEEYPILSYTNEIYSFIIETECLVSKENQYFFNGINYFLVVIAVEDGSLKIVQFNRPSVELIEEIVIPEISDNNVNYEAELAGVEVIKNAEQGRVVNAENVALTDGFEVIEVQNEYGISTFAADPPVINHYTTYSYPTKIKVKLNRTGNGEIVEVNMTDYMKNVLPNEWYPSWEEEALLAGAYCVKMVAIYRAVNPMSSSGGYNLTQWTQMYNPNSKQYESTSAAIDAIHNGGMAATSGFLFFPMYAAGTKGSAGTEGCGKARQWGTQYLAQQGYTHQQILNYYYSGSDYSKSDLLFFRYGIGY